jgi:putative transposase
MPSKNSLKYYYEGGFYHVYNRGAAKLPIFVDDEDKNKFLSLLDRYLNGSNTDKARDGGAYVKFSESVELLCYCLMGNHFHLLLYQKSKDSKIPLLLHAVFTAYTMYFNFKYKRQGTLFQGVYKASNVDDYLYIRLITRYIHLNPVDYLSYKYSSLKYFYGENPPIWLKPDRILNLFASSESYKRFTEGAIDTDSAVLLEEISSKFHS